MSSTGWPSGDAAVMPNVTRGERMGGLLSYLVGPGRSNEHTEPHLVAGDEAVLAWHDDAELDRVSALQVAKHLDRPRAVYGTQVPGGSVWHCSLSLRAEEGQLDDGQWADITRDFVQRMGFTDAPAEPGDASAADSAGDSGDAPGDVHVDATGERAGRAPCRWVAVRHGLSTAGNDHVHVVVSLVREDGTKASTWKDFARAQRVAGELERKYGLEVLESRDADRGTRGVSPAEQARTERTGAPEPDRVVLGRTVRAVAGSSVDEATFVTGLREQGLWVRARYAAGRDDVVVGYSVAARPAGERAVWFGGGHLGRDLTITRLRAGWPDTPQASAAAVSQWQAARRGQPTRGPRAGAGGSARVGDEQLVACTREVQALREHLASIPAGDRAGWAHAAREVSGALSAWSRRVEVRPGALARSADALARYSSTRAYLEPPRVARAAARPSLRGTTLLLMTAADGGRGRAAEAVLVRQLLRTAQAIHDAQVATGQARSAEHLAVTVRAELAPLVRARPLPAEATAEPVTGRAESARYSDRATSTRAATEADQGAVRAARPDDSGASPGARTSASGGRPLGSPLPNALPQRPHTTAHPGRAGSPGSGGRDDGVER